MTTEPTHPKAQAGDTDSVPGREDPTHYRQLSLCAVTTEPTHPKAQAGDTDSVPGREDPTHYRQLSLCAVTTEPTHPEAHAPQHPLKAAGEGLSSGAALCFTTKPKKESVIPF